MQSEFNWRLVMKWEYYQDELNFCIVDKRYYWTYANGWFKTKIDAFNYLGESAWELVVVEGEVDCYTFKRPVQE